MAGEKIELVGGPRDGEFVEDLGPRRLEMAPVEARAYWLTAAPPEIAHLDFPSFYADAVPVIEYEKRIDSATLRPIYVCRGEGRR